MDIKLALMCGSDIPIPECQLVVHQPTIKEISLIGDKDFFIGLQTLCIDKDKLFIEEKSILTKSNFEIFMSIINQKEDVEKKNAVQQVFLLLFPELKVVFTPRTLMFTGGPQPLIVDENNFNALQQVIQEIGCLNSDTMNKDSFNPADKRAQEIANKLMRGRQIAAKQKGEKESGSALARYLSILTIGLGSMGITQLMNLTLYQLYDLVERYMLFVQWDMDAKSRLAGGKPDSQPDNWMKNLH